MKTLRVVLLTMFLLGVPTAAAYAQPALGAGLHIGPSGRPTMDVGLFYDDLAPYGYWVDRPAHGWAWVPRDVAPAWRPYTDGHWALTDMGWTWISDEPFGWATYHYGSWYSDPVYGWSWIPGDEWAPARVSWRESNDFIGWAPLPPPRIDLLPASFVFVPARSFLAPDIFVSAVPLVESVRLFPRTRTVTTYRMVNRRFVNFGVPVERVERLVGRPVPRYQVVDLSPDLRHRGARIAGNRVALFRPQVEKVRVAPPPGRPVARGAMMTPRVAAHLKAARSHDAVAMSHMPSGALRHEERAEKGDRRVRREMTTARTTSRTIAAPGRELRSASSRKLEVRHGGRSVAGAVRQTSKHQVVHRRSAHAPERHVVSSRRQPTRRIQTSHVRHESMRQHVSRSRPPQRTQRMTSQPRMSRHGGGGSGAFRGHAGGGGGHGKRRPPTRR